jgi:hypothetical protein
MRQNAGPIRAFAGFKRLISVIKYQELMPDPFAPQQKPGINRHDHARVHFPGSPHHGIFPASQVLC